MNGKLFYEQKNKAKGYLFQLRKLGEIMKKAGGINESFFESADPHLDYLSGKLRIFRGAAVFLAGLVSTYKGEAVSMPELCCAFGMDWYEIVEYFQDSWESLEGKGLIEVSRGREGPSGCHGDMTFAVSFRTIAALKGELNQGELAKTTAGEFAAVVKQPQSIVEKQLYYPPRTQEAVNALVSLLQKDNFHCIQKRLSERRMRTGFACLFSGSPGTGKTETAHQIARISGRGIMEIDIASTKSKWLGESEKRIKSIFDKYRAAVNEMAVTPILFFNEAEAVFNKRLVFVDSEYNGPTPALNAMQNIILSELENLNGILIATTNLATNMDIALERRFLYKIEFEKPEITTRKAIWSSMIPELSEDDAHKLALCYDFSGGQIENIARKLAFSQVISGKPMSMK